MGTRLVPVEGSQSGRALLAPRKQADIPAPRPGPSSVVVELPIDLELTCVRELTGEAMATAEQPPAPQPVQQAAQGPPPVLREGYIQGCQGYLKRRTKFLKRWKKQWFSVVPGELTEIPITYSSCAQ